MNDPQGEERIEKGKGKGEGEEKETLGRAKSIKQRPTTARYRPFGVDEHEEHKRVKVHVVSSVRLTWSAFITTIAGG